MTDDGMLLDDYDQNFAIYSAFAEKLRQLATEILSERRVTIHSVSCRTKERESLSRKLAKGGEKYGRMADVTDIVGVRIITFFEDDVRRVAAAIEEEFDVDRGNSVDKRDLLDPDRFGYLSLHYIVALPQRRTALGEYRRYFGLKAEIQVRSILQHAWAEIEHDLGYKTAAGIPRDIRRRFSQLAGLLEMADREFSQIREALSRYESSVTGRIVEDPDEVSLDKASYVAYVAADGPVRSADSQIAQIVGGTVSEVNHDVLERHVLGLISLGLFSVGAVDAAFRAAQQDVINFAGQWLKHAPSLDKAAFAPGVSLMFFQFVRAYKIGGQAQLAKLLQVLSISDDTERPEVVADIMRAMTEAEIS